ncbi:hypothetical protein GW766_01040 [Candidatus Parcubacteria bacterium]|nr:hypothetical protein [Candidatus Parcubacteria bacterium]
MFDFYQKRKFREIVNSPITQGVILTMCLIIGWSAYVRFDVAMEMRERRIQAETQTAALESHKATLKDKVEYLSSDRGIEAEMRRQFDVALPDEKVVVIIDREEDGKSIASTSTMLEEPKERVWYQFWQ